jgi:hypothetical protein
VSSIVSWKPPLDLVAKLLDPTISAAHLRVGGKRITKRVHTFLGFMQCFSCSIPRFADTAACLHDLTKDGPALWTHACTESWNTLCSYLSHAFLMHQPDFDLPFYVHFDAFLRGIVELLLQLHGDEPKLVAYCAPRLQPCKDTDKVEAAIAMMQFAETAEQRAVYKRDMVAAVLRVMDWHRRCRRHILSANT